jgi:hypothetical protein
LAIDQILFHKNQRLGHFSAAKCKENARNSTFGTKDDDLRKLGDFRGFSR